MANNFKDRDANEILGAIMNILDESNSRAFKKNYSNLIDFKIKEDKRYTKSRKDLENEVIETQAKAYKLLREQGQKPIDIAPVFKAIKQQLQETSKVLKDFETEIEASNYTILGLQQKYEDEKARGDIKSARKTFSLLEQAHKKRFDLEEQYDEYREKNLKNYSQKEIDEQNRIEQIKLKKQENIQKQYDKLIAKARSEEEKYNLEQEKKKKLSAIENSSTGSKLGDLMQSAGGKSALDIVASSDSKLASFAGTLSRGFANPVVQALTAGFNLLNNRIGQSVTEIANMYSSYMGPINTRLQGTNDTLETIWDTSKASLGTNAYVNQKKYLENINRLVESGISYNLEERALIATVGDRIATTFDVLDQNLNRLIRLEQADLTRQQIGAEASITNFLNSTFNDTSYLNSTYDSVYGSLLEATSQMNPDQATSFAYAVQKWLGSLYSVGLSDSATQSIASGLSYLSTGNVNALGGNDALQRLLALSVNRAGLSYSDLLTRGLVDTDVDKIMQSMVEYLQDISKNTSSQVMKSQWANILGLAVSDIRAFSNLNESDLATISGVTNLTYETANKEFLRQSQMIGDRTFIGDIVSNIIDNFFMSVGEEIVSNEPLYLAYNINKVTGPIADVFGEHSIIGTLISSVGNVASSLIGGATVIEELGKMFLNGTFLDTFKLDWDEFNATAYNNRRGETYLGLDKVSGVSASTVVAETKDNIIVDFQQQEEAIVQSSETIESKETEVIDTLDRLYDMLFESQTTPIKINLDTISDGARDILLSVLLQTSADLSSNLENSINLNSNYVNRLADSLYAIRRA